MLKFLRQYCCEYLPDLPAVPAEPLQRWQRFSVLPPPGLPRTQSFNMGTGLQLLAGHPGHASLVPHEQEVLPFKPEGADKCPSQL